MWVHIACSILSDVNCEKGKNQALVLISVKSSHENVTVTVMYIYIYDLTS